MQLTAQLIQILPPLTGTSNNKIWKRQEIIVETNDVYRKKVSVAIWGDLISLENLKIEKWLEIDFEIESREYNGKWYTQVKAKKIHPLDVAPEPPFRFADIPTYDFENDSITIKD